jgi:hypothetical protein
LAILVSRSKIDFAFAAASGRAGQFEQLLHVRLVGRAVGLHFLVGREVVIAARHAKAALHHVGHDRVGRAHALRDEHAEQVFGVEVGRVERIGVGAHLFAERAGERGLVGDGVDGLEVGVDGRQALRLDRAIVHVGGVVVGDLARVGAGGRVVLADVLDDLGVALLGELEHGEEGAGGGAVARDSVLLRQPPLAYSSKSSPGLTFLSMPARSTPSVGAALAVVAAAAGFVPLSGAVGAFCVHRRPGRK